MYCAHAFPEGTPATGAAILKEHIMVCTQHPIREVLAENKALTEQLQLTREYIQKLLGAVAVP